MPSFSMIITFPIYYYVYLIQTKHIYYVINKIMGFQIKFLIVNNSILNQNEFINNETTYFPQSYNPWIFRNIHVMFGMNVIQT